jgi:dTMP kinase
VFITLEGSEGSGKSTQIQPLAAYLGQRGYDVLVTREPGGTSIGEQIRDILSNLTNTAMQQRTEILLFQAARAQHVDEVIQPHLAKGGIVLCDRFADSTLAYQGYGYQRELETIRQIVNFATGGLKPDLTLFLDIDVEEGLRRRSRGGEWNRLDSFEMDFYRRVREGYLEMVRAEPQRWEIIDASQRPDIVQQKIRQVVFQRLQVN